MQNRRTGEKVEDNAMDKLESVLDKLKENGFRITKQRKLLIDIILSDEFCSIKEIYYKAIRQDPAIGIATVYRMINVLEDIGAINRRNMYKINL